MKNGQIFRIGAITLGLFAATLILNSTNAIDTSTQVTITAGAQTCRVGTGVAFSGTTAASSTDTTLTGNFNTSSGTNIWTCTDLSGGATFSVSIIASDLVKGADRIGSGNIAVSNYQEVRTQGGCGTGVTAHTNAPLSGTQVLLQATGSASTLCEVQTTGVVLQVIVPAYKPTGLYTGTITITTPAGFTLL